MSRRRRAIRQAEVGAARTHDRRARSSASVSIRSAGSRDSAYGSAEMLGWLVHEHGIEPHIPVFDKSERTDGTFEREGFTYRRSWRSPDPNDPVTVGPHLEIAPRSSTICRPTKSTQSAQSGRPILAEKGMAALNSIPAKPPSRLSTRWIDEVFLTGSLALVAPQYVGIERLG